MPEFVNYARTKRALGLDVIRNGTELSIVVVPEEVPINQAPQRTDKYGLKVIEITPAVKSYMGLRSDGGIMVFGAADSTRAALWGFHKGDIIHHIGTWFVALAQCLIDP